MHSVKRIIELTDEIKTTEEHVQALKDERALIEAQLIDEWMEEGLHSVNIDGRNVHIRIDTYAVTPLGMEPVVDKLAAMPEFAHLVKQTVHKGQLSALVRELTEDGAELPPDWEGVIERGQRPAIRVTKA